MIDWSKWIDNKMWLIVENGDNIKVPQQLMYDYRDTLKEAERIRDDNGDAATREMAWDIYSEAFVELKTYIHKTYNNVIFIQEDGQLPMITVI